MEFDAGGAGIRAGVDLPEDRVDKIGHFLDTGVEEPPGDDLKPAPVGPYIQPAFRSDLLASFRHQCRQMRPDFAAKCDHLFVR